MSPEARKIINYKIRFGEWDKRKVKCFIRCLDLGKSIRHSVAWADIGGKLSK